MIQIPERGQLIVIDGPAQTELAVVINFFPHHLLVCEVHPRRIEDLKPVILRSCQVINCRLEMDLYINLLSLQVIEKSKSIRKLGRLHVGKFYEVLRHLDWLVLGKLQFKRERRRREEPDKWL